MQLNIQENARLKILVLFYELFQKHIINNNVSFLAACGRVKFWKNKLFDNDFLCVCFPSLFALAS